MTEIHDAAQEVQHRVSGFASEMREKGHRPADVEILMRPEGTDA